MMVGKVVGLGFEIISKLDSCFLMTVIYVWFLTKKRFDLVTSFKANFVNFCGEDLTSK